MPDKALTPLFPAFPLEPLDPDVPEVPLTFEVPLAPAAPSEPLVPRYLMCLMNQMNHLNHQPPVLQLNLYPTHYMYQILRQFECLQPLILLSDRMTKLFLSYNLCRHVQ